MRTAAVLFLTQPTAMIFSAFITVVDLIHDIRHLCTRFRIHVLKAMSRGISGYKQKIKFAFGVIADKFVYSFKRKTDVIVTQNVRVSMIGSLFLQVLCHYCLL